MEFNNITYTVTSIGANAFADCSNLKSVNLPNTITNIGDYSFTNCFQLKDIVIPSSVNSIGVYPFNNSGIENIYIHSITPPSLVYGLGNNYNTNVKVPCTSKTLYQNADYWSWINNIQGLEDILVEIYDTISSGGIYTNYGLNVSTSGVYNSIQPMQNGCDSILRINLIVEPIKSIYNGDTIYYNITSNTSPYTAEVTYLGENYYSVEEYRDSIIIPTTITVNQIDYIVNRIGESAFGNSYNLRYIELPSTITSIGYYAFANTGLEKFVVLSNIPPEAYGIGIYSNIPIYVNCESKANYLNSNNWIWNSNLMGLGDTIINIKDTIITGQVYNKYGLNETISGEYYSRVIMQNGCDSIMNISLVVLPLYSINFGDTIYYNVTSLVSPKTVEVTFSGNNYYSDSRYRDTIIIPNSINVDSENYIVSSIGNYAFRNAYNLKYVELPNSIIRIGEYAFANSPQIKKLIIPTNVIQIDFGTFSDNQIEEIILEPIIPPSLSWQSGLDNNTKLIVQCQAKQNYLNNQNWNSLNINGQNDIHIDIYDTITTGQIYAKNNLYLTNTGIYQSRINLQNGCDSVLNIHLYVKPFIQNMGNYNLYFNITSVNPNRVELTFSGENPYSVNEYFGNIIIPDSVIIDNQIYSVTAIGNGCFAGDNQLLSVSLPNSIIEIRNFAFENTNSLASLTIPSSVNYIRNDAFTGSGIQEIFMLPNTPPNIDYNLGINYDVPIYVSCNSKPLYNSNYSWNSNYNIKGIGDVNIDIYDTITTGQIYNNYGFQEYYSGDYKRKIPLNSGCDSVINLHLEVLPIVDNSTGKNIYYNITSNVDPYTVEVTFFGRDPLIIQEYFDTIIIPQSIMIDSINYMVNSISYGAFEGNFSLKYVVLPNTIMSIYENAFNYCPNLKYIILPPSVGFLGYNVFGYDLEGIRVEASTPPHLHMGSGLNSNILINVTCGNKQAYLNSNEWSMFTNIIGDGDMEIDIFDTINTGQTYNNYGFSETNSGKYYRNITMLNGCDSILVLNLTVMPLIHVNQGDSIYYNIVSNQQPYTVEVTYFGSNYSSFNEYRDTITIPNSILVDNINYDVIGIGKDAFRDCYNLKYVNMPNSILYIKESAFQSCRDIQSLIIPYYVSLIGENVFMDNNLEYLRFEPITPPQFMNDPGFNQNVLIKVVCEAKANYTSITP
ncbi:MAG: leucine-rich repeat protein [Bacteroidales bacterium]